MSTPPPAPVPPGCPYDPKGLTGAPLGMLHCPHCGCMVIAGLEHPPCDIDDGCDYGVVIDYASAFGGSP